MCSTQRCTTNRVSICATILQWWRASTRRRSCWRSIPPSRSPALSSSLHMRGPIRARSPWPRMAPDRFLTWPPNCSRQRQASIRSMYRIEARHPCSPTCWVDRFKRHSTICLHLSGISGLVSFERSESRPRPALGHCLTSRASGELLPGYEASAFFGIGAPRDTPVAIINKLNEAINGSLADPKLTARLAELGGAPLVLSSTAFGKLIGDETDKWGKVIRAASIRPE